MRQHIRQGQAEKARICQAQGLWHRLEHLHRMRGIRRAPSGHTGFQVHEARSEDILEIVPVLWHSDSVYL